jgi:hypothetical protein
MHTTEATADQICKKVQSILGLINTPKYLLNELEASLETILLEWKSEIMNEITKHAGSTPHPPKSYKKGDRCPYYGGQWICRKYLTKDVFNYCDLCDNCCFKADYDPTIKPKIYQARSQCPYQSKEGICSMLMCNHLFNYLVDGQCYFKRECSDKDVFYHKKGEECPAYQFCSRNKDKGLIKEYCKYMDDACLFKADYNDGGVL